VATDLRSKLLTLVDEVEAVLSAHADEAEAIRTLPEPSWRALHDRGLFRLKAPRELGGFEADPVTQILVFERVAAIDTSAGWALFVGAGNLAFMSAWLPDAGIADVLVEGRLPRVAGGLMPTGSATKVDGGYRLSGRWQFGSGSGHAEWLFGNGFVEGPDPRAVLSFVFPRDAAVVDEQSWTVNALRGTGSFDISVAEVFVPEHRTYNAFARPARGGPLYQLRLPGFVAMEHGAFALGVARRAIEEMTELAKSKARGYVNPQGVAARGVFQSDLGHCDLALRAARSALVDAYDRAWGLVSAGENCDVATQTQLRGAAVYATDVAIEVCRKMFTHAGARSLFGGNVIERCLRDVTAAGQHAMVSDGAYEKRGQVLLGFPDTTPMD
jgi:alkylation response protein AidB-like acyl-CoA dehydrogenase